jgi:extracellular factor (EF) 3-hydroxypalmitic acid methyl ester biosynthesis protein
MERKGTMIRSPQVFTGWLQTRTGKVEISARYASRHSLWVEMGDRRIDSRIATLLLHLGDRLVDVGLCRILNAPADAAERRLVSLGREHDFERLLSASEAGVPKPSIQDLTSILSAKERIVPAFRDFVTNLTYDMNAYCTTLDRADALSRDAPLSAREGVLENAVAQVGPRLFGNLDGQFRRMHQIIRNFSAQEHEAHGLYLRCQMWNLLLRAPMVARAILKPCGNRPDPELARLICTDSLLGESTFGKLLHKYAVNIPAARAIRARRAAAVNMMKGLARTPGASSGEMVDVLAVGSDLAVAMGDLFKSHAAQRLRFSLMDEDEESLLEAAWQVGEMRRLHGSEISITYLKESVESLSANRGLPGGWGRFHFICVKDALDNVAPMDAARILRVLLGLLRPGGRLVTWALHEGDGDRFTREYMTDWKPFSWTDEELDKLVREIPEARISLLDDETGSQRQVVLDKPPEESGA